MKRYLVLHEGVKPDTDWSRERFTFNYKKCDFSDAPMFIRDDGVNVFNILWLINKTDTIKYDGVIAYVKGDVFKGIWGNHSKEYKQSFQNEVIIGNKKFSVLQVEHHKGVYRKPVGILGNIKMVSTRKKTSYPQSEYTFNHELAHSYKYQNGGKDYLHLAIKWGNYNGYMDSIPKNKVYPLRSWDKVSQAFGVRDIELYPRFGVHYGVDHPVPSGTPIFAPVDGFLREDDTGVDALGNHCLFSFRDGRKYYTLLFAHLSKKKKYGPYKQGDIIGYTGNTGFSTGPHCHTELWKGLVVDRNDIRSMTIDPIKYYN